MALDFEECELSGHLKADGTKGQYWILEEVWTYLQRVTPTASGPLVLKLGTFSCVDDAKKEANILDV